MHILTISDTVDKGLYHAEILQRRAGHVQLIISCGDLPNAYMDFIASVLRKPLLYVRGNHFWIDKRTGQLPITGGNLDNRVVNERGLLVGGLEGSMRYKPGEAQYTDFEMWLKILNMLPRLVLNRIRYGRYIDLLVTHAPPFGIHDRPDRTHQGFKAFLPFMRWFKPRYLLHGHIHVWDNREVTRTRYHDTWVVNVYPWRIIEVEHDLEAYLSKRYG